MLQGFFLSSDVLGRRKCLFALGFDRNTSRRLKYVLNLSFPSSDDGKISTTPVSHTYSMFSAYGHQMVMIR